MPLDRWGKPTMLQGSELLGHSVLSSMLQWQPPLEGGGEGTMRLLFPLSMQEQGYLLPLDRGGLPTMLLENKL